MGLSVVNVCRDGDDSVIGCDVSPSLVYSLFSSFVGSEPLVAPKYASSPASKDDARCVLRSVDADDEALGWTEDSTAPREV